MVRARLERTGDERRDRPRVLPGKAMHGLRLGLPDDHPAHVEFSRVDAFDNITKGWTSSHDLPEGVGDARTKEFVRAKACVNHSLIGPTALYQAGRTSSYIYNAEVRRKWADPGDGPGRRDEGPTAS